MNRRISYLCDRCVYKIAGNSVCDGCDCGDKFIERSRYVKGENETMICNEMYITTANPYDSMHKRFEDYTKYIREGTCSLTKLGRVCDIKKVIFNDPATIVFWSDGTKTVVKCGENDEYDPEKGLAMAIAKRALGNQGNYYNEFKKWLPEKVEEKEDEKKEEGLFTIDNVIDQAGPHTRLIVEKIFSVLKDYSGGCTKVYAWNHEFDNDVWEFMIYGSIELVSAIRRAMAGCVIVSESYNPTNNAYVFRVTPYVEY